MSIYVLDINGKVRACWQPANPGLPGKTAVKMISLCVAYFHPEITAGKAMFPQVFQRTLGECGHEIL